VARRPRRRLLFLLVLILAVLVPPGLVATAAAAAPAAARRALTALGILGAGAAVARRGVGRRSLATGQALDQLAPGQHPVAVDAGLGGKQVEV
jgi:hypothetical protein